MMISAITTLIVAGSMLMLFFVKENRTENILKQTFKDLKTDQDEEYEWEEGEWLVEEGTAEEKPTQVASKPEPAKEPVSEPNLEPTPEQTKLLREFQNELPEPFLENLHLIEPFSILLPDALTAQNSLMKQPDEIEKRHQLSQRLDQAGKWAVKLYHELDLQSLCADVYFTDTWYMPYFRQQGYSIKEMSGATLAELIDRVAPGHTIIISIKDDGSQAITDPVRPELTKRGIQQLSRANLRWSYVNIIRKKEAQTCESMLELLQEERVEVNPDTHPLLQELPARVQVISAGSNTGNKSSILVDGQEHSHNQRGMNIVVLDEQGRVSLSTYVDTFVTLMAENSLFLARKEKKATTNIWANNHLLIAPTRREDFEQNYTLDYRVFTVNLLAENEVEEACRLLGLYPDIYLLTSTRSDDKADITKQYQALVELAKQDNPAILDRVIPEVRDQMMFDAIHALHRFNSYIYSPKQSETSDEEVMWLAYRNGIRIVSVSEDRFTPELADLLLQKGIFVYLETLHNMEQIEMYLEQGVQGFYSDQLIPVGLTQLKVRLEVQREVLLETLEKYWTVVFPEQAVEAVLEQARAIRSVKKLDNILLGAFKLDNLAGIKDLLARESEWDLVSNSKR